MLYVPQSLSKHFLFNAADELHLGVQHHGTKISVGLSGQRAVHHFRPCDIESGFL